jgi:uncharacterized protein GlcG (DUF336 family)
MKTFAKQSVSFEAARKLVEAALEEARSLGLAVTVAVCDESGVLKAFTRMDGSALANVQSSQDKAYTAVAIGIASHQWYPMIKDDPALLHGVVGAIDRLVIFGGGVPIKVDGHLAGGIGVGGGSHEQDRQVAEAAVKALAAEQ